MTADPDALRDHLHELRLHGGTYRTIAEAATVAPTTVHDLAIGRRDGTGSIARALLAVTSDELPQGRLDAGGTRLRLRALHVMGHSSARIARAVGASDKTIRKLVRGDAKTISPATARHDRRRLRRLVGQTRPWTYSRRTHRGHGRPPSRHRW